MGNTVENQQFIALQISVEQYIRLSGLSNWGALIKTLSIGLGIFSLLFLIILVASWFVF